MNWTHTDLPKGAEFEQSAGQKVLFSPRCVHFRLRGGSELLMVGSEGRQGARETRTDGGKTKRKTIAERWKNNRAELTGYNFLCENFSLQLLLTNTSTSPTNSSFVMFNALRGCLSFWMHNEDASDTNAARLPVCTQAQTCGTPDTALSSQGANMKVSTQTHSHTRLGAPVRPDGWIYFYSTLLIIKQEYLQMYILHPSVSVKYI